MRNGGHVSGRKVEALIANGAKLQTERASAASRFEIQSAAAVHEAALSIVTGEPAEHRPTAEIIAESQITLAGCDKAISWNLAQKAECEDEVAQLTAARDRAFRAALQQLEPGIVEECQTLFDQLHVVLARGIAANGLAVEYGARRSHASPLSSWFGPVGELANALAGLLDRRHPLRPRWAPWNELRNPADLPGVQEERASLMARLHGSSQ